MLGRFDLIIAILIHIIMDQGRASGIAFPRLIQIWQRITRLAARFTRAALIGPRPRRIRAPQIRKPAPIRPEPPLPTSQGWLRRLLPDSETMPSALIYPAQQLSDLLADPAMAELIETNPAIGRTLRPLFAALGMARPPILAIPAPQPEPEPQPDPPQAHHAAYPAGPPGNPIVSVPISKRNWRPPRPPC